ncbi:708_t:CDS:10, partial [Scutellospora calospora]
EAVAKKIMPDLNHKIKDFQYHTWHITDWKNLENRVFGPEFKAGGWNWRLLLFPYGNFNYYNKDHVGIYLDFVNPKDGLHASAQFALVLWNQEEPTKFVSHNSYHFFAIGDRDWGFTEFYEKDKLFIPSDKLTRPLIENDSCNITALVRVFEDPKYIGLKYYGINTFINSVLQLLYHIKSFRKAVYQIPIECDKPAKSITSALQRIFYQLNVSDTVVETTELTKFFGWNTFIMDDVREFIKVLQDDLEDKMKNTKADGIINKLFVGTIKTYIKCDNVDYEYLYIEDYYDIQFSVKESESIHDSFTRFTREESLEGDNKYDAERYGLQVAKKRVTFESFPPVLRIYLEYNASDVKSKRQYEFPVEIDLEKYLSPDKPRSDKYRYLLHGALVHDNATNKYYSYIRPELNQGWIKFNNNRVTPESISEVIQPYMLVYIRECYVDELLSPILPKDIPKYEENSDLYMQTWVVTEETFKSHRGLGLVDFNNEQYPFSEGFKFKFLKESTYDDFKKMVSVKFEIPIEQIKFWVIKNRRNKSIRLHKPVIDNDFLGKSMEEVKTELTILDDELILYMEILEIPININDNFLPTKSLKTNEIIIFLKYFNTDTQSLEKANLSTSDIHSRIDSIFPILCKKMKFSPKTLFDIYEEYAPDMINKLISRYTFRMSGMQNGDIICFQKTLTKREIQKFIFTGHIYNILQFYESLSMNIIVQFKSKFGYRDPIPEFNLVLNKDSTFKTVAKQVAIYLNTDPLRLRFTSVDLYGKPKIEIDGTINQKLSEILQPAM